jgi:hypothetical protein
MSVIKSPSGQRRALRFSFHGLFQTQTPNRIERIGNEGVPTHLFSWELETIDESDAQPIPGDGGRSCRPGGTSTQNEYVRCNFARHCRRVAIVAEGASTATRDVRPLTSVALDLTQVQ